MKYVMNNKRNFRILVVTPWFPNTPLDGGYNFIFHSIESLIAKNNKVSVAVTRPWTPPGLDFFIQEWRRPSLKKDLFDSSLNLQVYQYLSLPRNYCHYEVLELFRWRMSHVIERMAQHISAQVIHVHTELTAIAAVPAAKRLGIPVVVTLHGINMAPRQLDSQKKRDRVQRTLGSADRVILVGEPLRDHFAPLAGGDHNFCVVPNGFHLPEGLSRKKPIFEDSTVKLVSVSNLHEGKGVDITLGALSLLLRRGVNNWKYVLVGDGDQRAELEKICIREGLDEKVTFLGRLPHAAALEQLTDADVFVLPSYREAFGVAYLEAMSTGLVTIGIAGQGPEAFIRDGVNGFLVPPQDIPSLANRLEFVLKSPEQCRIIGEAGRNTVENEFTWEHHAEGLISLYADVVGNG